MYAYVPRTCLMVARVASGCASSADSTCASFRRFRKNEERLTSQGSNAPQWLVVRRHPEMEPWREPVSVSASMIYYKWRSYGIAQEPHSSGGPFIHRWHDIDRPFLDFYAVQRLSTTSPLVEEVSRKPTSMYTYTQYVLRRWRGILD